MTHKLLVSFSPPARVTVPSLEKELFFTIKKNNKRIKPPPNLPQPQSADTHCNHHLGSTGKKGERKYLSADHKNGHKILVSTFGSEHFLSFRKKQPKRKRRCYIQSKGLLSVNQGEESGSDTERSVRMVRVYSVKQKNGGGQLKILCTQKLWKAADFVFLAKIGEGTYSEVFKVVEKMTGFVCSLKILNKQKLRQMKAEYNLFSEIKINFFLSHPNISTLYGCFSDQLSVYFVGEIATDHSLHDALNLGRYNGQRGMPVQVVKNYMGQLCEALKYMHGNCLLHRDVKPENMLITFTMTLKLCDFGWSTHNPGRELRSTLCGTPLYLAPELIQQTAYNESVDVWAAGVVAYEMLTSEIPFKIRSIRDLTKVVSQQIEYSRVPDPEAVHFISSAMKKKQEERTTIEALCAHPFLYSYQAEKQF